MITYSTNWMGPINADFIKEHGDYWSGGRLDIDDASMFGSEYPLPIMHKTDWRDLTNFCSTYTTEELATSAKILADFEQNYNRKIRWFAENNS